MPRFTKEDIVAMLSQVCAVAGFRRPRNRCAATQRCVMHLWRS
jgi:hypothetical protein